MKSQSLVDSDANVSEEPTATIFNVEETLLSATIFKVENVGNRFPQMLVFAKTASNPKR
jgi:hypothetical protein